MFQSDHLSLEKLLIHTIQVRSTAKLKDLEREFCCHVPGKCELSFTFCSPSCPVTSLEDSIHTFLLLFSGELRDLPTVLYVPILNPCMGNEKLSVSVNIQTGNFMVALGGKGEFQEAEVAVVVV